MKLRSNYNKSLEQLDQMIQEMGSQTLSALESAMAAWEAQDQELAREIMAGDAQINRQEKQIEQLCLELLLRQQPVAGDLRRVSAGLKMVTDLERLGDHAQDIAQLSLEMGSPREYPQWYELVNTMARTGREMVAQALESARTGNLEQAMGVSRRDNEVDEAFKSLKGLLAQSLAAQPGQMDEILDWLMLAKYLERVADHAVNLGEWVVFRITGSYRNTQVL